MSPMSPDRSPDAERPDEDVDAAFARIIAGWDDPPSTPNPPDAPSRPDAPSPPSVPPLPGPPDLGPRDYAPPPETEEGYVPPEPPPLPRIGALAALAWAAVLLGPLFLLFAGLFWRTASPLLLGLAVLAFIGGFGALVMRLPSHRDADSDDDGAVV